MENNKAAVDSKRTREGFIAGLRAAADYFESHPLLETPNIGCSLSTDITHWGVRTVEQFMLLTKELSPCEVVNNGSQALAVKDMGGSVTIRLCLGNEAFAKVKSSSSSAKSQDDADEFLSRSPSDTEAP